ncbi:hypothetical protein MMC28_000306 [Mycoblastus sanguinarius]|nr:hypothetical protein [Mycoblastus sanguinarius]
MLSQKRQTISSDSTHELVKHHFDGYLEKIYLETSGVPAKEAKDESIAKEKPILIGQPISLADRKDDVSKYFIGPRARFAHVLHGSKNLP